MMEVTSYECVGGPLDGAVLTPPDGSLHPVLVVRGPDNTWRPAYRPLPGSVPVGAVMGWYVLQVCGGATLRCAVWEPVD